MNLENRVVKKLIFFCFLLKQMDKLVCRYGLFSTTLIFINKFEYFELIGIKNTKFLNILIKVSFYYLQKV
ncbi:hypothetical protein LEP1GSC127_3302 [Leptospira kirschneri str. 200801925]|nr:hypothetical protein LEP1GSC127_3302 [Leptospira kirschneri str. 200801925]